MVCAGSVGTKAEAFEQAALALTAVVTDVHSVGGRELIDIRCEVPDDELRLAGWLNSLIYEMPVRKMLFPVLGAIRWQQPSSGVGEPVDSARHPPAVEIKGTNLYIVARRRAER